MVSAAIAVVDDDLSIRRGLKCLLEGEGYVVRTYADGERALAGMRESPPDLVLLDVMMPGLNGYAVCSRIRSEFGDLPVVFLTAKASETDELRAFGLGADDFVPKAANEGILLARLAGVLRRSRSVERQDARCDEPAQNGLFRLGGAVVDPRRMSVTDSSGIVSGISPRELELLRLFAESGGKVVSRDELVSRCWGEGCDCADSAVNTAIWRLRGKLGTDAHLISGRRGSGYSLCPSGKAGL